MHAVRETGASVREIEEATPPTGLRWRGYTWGLLAVLTCPCHLPVLALLLSDAAAGAVVGAHMGVAALVLAVLFALFLAAALRAFRGRL
jgi:mercuric ion transport protein